MKRENMIVYKCDHCTKKMFGAGVMSRHERFCKSNPNNDHKCFQRCDFLEKRTETVFSNDPDEPEADHFVTHFTCLKTSKKLYSYKFEKSKGFKPIYLQGLERMPLECDLYESENWIKF